MTVVTDADDKLIFPADMLINSKDWKGFTVPGTNVQSSKALVYTDLASPKYFTKGQQLRMWHIEDLTNYWPGDNDGIHCAKYILSSEKDFVESNLLKVIPCDIV